MRSPENPLVEQAVSEVARAFACCLPAFASYDPNQYRRWRIEASNLSERLRTEILDALPPLKVPKRRNFLIVMTLGYVEHRYGWKPTRNDDHGEESVSGAVIVSKALARNGIKLKERTVEDIWTNRGRTE
jgi:hypothetical protein